MLYISDTMIVWIYNLLYIYTYSDDGIEVGIDEAGRGCLCGRVYAAAVILPNTFPDEIYLEIKDSKKEILLK